MRRTQGRSPKDDEDEEQLESFQRQRLGTLIDKLLGVLVGVTLAALVLSLVGQIPGQSLLSQLFTGPLSGGPDQPPGQTNESLTPAQLPAVTEQPVVAETRPVRTETPPPARPNSESPSAGGPASTKLVSPRDVDSLTPRQRETSGPSEVTGTATAPSPQAVTPKVTPPQLVGSHRAKLVRKPVSRGWGDSYAVRLLDPAGQPLVVAEVLLVVRMADGTVENVAMGALPEPGTYRGTVPTGRSTPVDLRVRVRTGDKFVEVPVRP